MVSDSLHDWSEMFCTGQCEEDESTDHGSYRQTRERRWGRSESEKPKRDGRNIEKKIDQIDMNGDAQPVGKPCSR